jgi:thiol-disulfide isomerase/thioredoxin
MLPNRKKNLKNMIVVLVITLAMLPVVFGYARRGEAFGYGSNAKSPEHERINSLFEELGIIRLSSRTLPRKIKLNNINGKTQDISDLKGKVVFINFWATWCPDCRVEMPEMEKLYNRFKEDDFAMVAISLRETSQKVSAFFKNNKLTFEALLDLDGSVGEAFRIRSIPTTYILDKRGDLIGKAMGPRKWGSQKSVELFQILVRSKHARVKTGK